MPDENQPTPLLSRYRIEEKLGEGGMGVVYRATDLRLGRTVALKMLHQGLGADSESHRRLEKEARTASALNHPAIATLHDIENQGEATFLVYEYVKGKTLRELHNAGTLSLADLLSIFISIAEGLTVAHEAHIIHRDLKPENVMFAEDGRVKILDFGLAKVVRSPLELSSVPTAATVPGMMLGTVAYMSPEQIENETVDHRSDVFSLGIMLYELATKRHPFLGKSPGSTIGNILKEEPPDMTGESRAIPAELDRVVRKCIRKKREERYQSLRDLAVDLNAVRAKLSGVHTTAPSPMTEFALPRKPSWVMFILTQCGYLVLYGAALYYAETSSKILARDFLLPESTSLIAMLVLAMCGTATRLYLLTAIGWNHPNAGNQFRKLFPAILLLDGIWAAAPLLLQEKIGYIAFGCIVLMAYLPFAQRTLVAGIYDHPR